MRRSVTPPPILPSEALTAEAFPALLTDLRSAAMPLFVQRIRAGLVLLLLAIVLFGAELLGLDASLMRRLLAVKLVQLATVVTVWALTRRGATWRLATGLALGTVTEVALTTAVSGIVRGEATSSLMVLSVLVMATATLLPWGPWLQLGAVVANGSAVVVNLVLAPHGLAEPGPPLVGFAIAALTSVYVAGELERYRVARFGAERKVRAEAARNAAIVQSALDGIVTMDHEGRIREFNPAAERVFGHARADVLGRPLGEVLVPPSLRDAHRRGLARYLARGESTVLGKRIEVGALRADGSEFPVELAVTRIEGSDPPLFTGYLRDLTERRLAQEARISAVLVRAGQEMMALLDSALIVERLGAIAEEVLPGDACQVLVWTPAGEGGAPAIVLQTAAPGGAAPTLDLDALRAALTRDDVVHLTEVSVQLHVPLRRDTEVVGALSIVRLQTGFTSEEVSIGRGLGQIASMALTNAHLVEAVAHASRIKSEFLSTMSHELRTPLNAILGYAEMLDDAGDADERRVFTGRIRDKGRELLGLVEDTLDIGHVDAGGGNLLLAPVRLRPLWNELGARCTALPRAAAVALHWGADLPDATMRSDRRKLSAVVHHLVHNALKFTERGEVRATATVHDGELVLEVRDTGIGIDPRDRDAVFELFRQLDGSESRRYGGTGLGLFLVRRFVDQLGGTVGLEGAAGGGSVFTVRLPLAGPPAVAQAPRAA